MSDTLQREFTPGSVVTGWQQQSQPSQLVPGMQVAAAPTPITRPSFVSAFLQNLGPALAGGMAADPRGGFFSGLGGAFQGIEQQNRYNQQLALTQAQMQRQATLDQSEMDLRRSQESRNNALALKDLSTPPTKPDLAHNVVETDQGIMQYNPATQRYDINVGKPPAPKTPAGNDFDAFYKQFLSDNKLQDSAANKLRAHQLWTTNPQSTGSQNDTRLDKSYQFNATQLEKLRTPIDAAVDRLARLNDSIDQKTPQADAVIAPELLSVMAGGQGSGLRMNEAEISRIVGGRTAYESLRAALNKYQLDPSKGLSITDAQRGQIKTLVGAVQRRISQKQQILNDAQQNLVDATDVTKHRQIIADTQKKLMQVDSGNYQPQSTGGRRVIDFTQ